MTEVHESIKSLRDGQVLQIYFDALGKEEKVFERDERAGIYTRGVEERYLDEPGGDSTKRG